MHTQLFRLWFCGLLAFAALGSAAALAQPAALSDPGSRQSGAAPGAGILPVEPNVDGGIIPIGATAQVVLRFRNDGAQPVETGLIRLYPSSNVSGTVTLNQCEEAPLPSGAECAIAISVKGLQAGAWRVELLMSHSGRTRLVTATMSGTVEIGEGSDTISLDVEAIPDEVDFGSLNASQTLVQPIILRNITSTPIEMSDIYVDAGDLAGYTLKTECKTLEPGQSCIATVNWAPKLKGPSTGVLVVKHNGPTALTSVILNGTYAPDTVDQAEVFPEAVPGKGLLVSSQKEVDFGTGIETASTITVSLVNAGDAPVTLMDIQVSGTDNGLSFRGKGCAAGTVLQPVEACPLTVHWAPTRAGNLLDDIQITHNGARGILVMPVRGGAGNPVSQDQGTIMLSSTGPSTIIQGGLLEDETGEEYEIVNMAESGVDGGGLSDTEIETQRQRAAQLNASRMSGMAGYATNIPNPSAVLDGLKITSFSPNRAIINGPSGSRIVFNKEPIVLGGIPWDVNIQSNGIEFSHQGQTVLLLFDRSLSSINRVQSQSSGGSGSSSSGSSSSSSGSKASSSSDGDA